VTSVRDDEIAGEVVVSLLHPLVAPATVVEVVGEAVLVAVVSMVAVVVVCSAEAVAAGGYARRTCDCRSQ